MQNLLLINTLFIHFELGKGISFDLIFKHANQKKLNSLCLGVCVIHITASIVTPQQNYVYLLRLTVSVNKSKAISF